MDMFRLRDVVLYELKPMQRHQRQGTKAPTHSLVRSNLRCKVDAVARIDV